MLLLCFASTSASPSVEQASYHVYQCPYEMPPPLIMMLYIYVYSREIASDSINVPVINLDPMIGVAAISRMHSPVAY